MDLFEKVKTIYPELTDQDFIEYIRFRDDSDGKGQYISMWNHPTLPRPTEEQLA